jgi:hypothetical protein
LSSAYRLNQLVEVMSKDTISLPNKVTQLGEELAKFYDHAAFLTCQSMGELLRCSLNLIEQEIQRKK